jgi:hypothetical protein
MSNPREPAGQEERFGKNYGAGEWAMVNKATILAKA